MNKNIVAYINTLSVIILAQTLKIQDQERTIDSAVSALRQCEDTIRAITKTMFGNMDQINIE